MSILFQITDMGNNEVVLRQSALSSEMTLTSNSPEFLIRMTSDPWTTRTGFRLEYSQVSGNKTFTAKS